MRDRHFQALQRRVLLEHFDANETEFLERELNVLRTKVLEVQYPELKARLFAPKASDIPSSATVYSYKIYDRVGQAQFGSYDSKDEHRIDAKAREEFGRVYPVTASYDFTINELREAARTNTPLTELKARIAKESIERGVDSVIAFGSIPDANGAFAASSLQGMINNSDVIANSILAGTAWSTSGTASPTNMLSDLNAMARASFAASKQVFRANTILLPSTQYMLAQQTPFSTQLGDSVLTVFLRNMRLEIPEFDVQPWYQLDKADAAATDKGGRAIAYQKDPAVLEAVIPQEFEALPPVAEHFKLVTSCHARTGGVKVYQPIAMKYCDLPAAT